jgi:hypothetical protein
MSESPSKPSTKSTDGNVSPDDFSLAKILDNAIQKHHDYQFEDAHLRCDKIISALGKQDLTKMTMGEKNILALAHALKGDMLYITGTEEEEILAINHIDTALEINPGLSEVRLMKDVLYVETNISYKPS